MTHATSARRRPSYVPARQMRALRRVLTKSVPGPLHDQVDAFMCAWVARLYPDGLEACGEPPDDVIWIPHADRVRIPVANLSESSA